MPFAHALSQASDLEAAVDEIRRALSPALGEQPDLLLFFASPPVGSDPAALWSALRHTFPGCALAGCSGQSVLAGGRELEDKPGLAVFAARAPGVQVESFALNPELLAKRDWAEHLGIGLGESAGLILLAHPATPGLEGALGSLDRGLPEATCVGGLASGGPDPRSSWIAGGSGPATLGVSGLAIRGSVRLHSVVAQGCRPVGQPSFITRSEGNAIFELDGAAPMEVLNRVFSEASPREQELLRSALFLGLGMPERDGRYGRGDFLVRNVLGLHAESGALLVAADLQDHQVVQFHVRDAIAADEDLRARIGSHRSEASTPSGALLFSCLGRGRGLYGSDDHDSEVFAEHFPGVPLAGFFCNGEIGPVSGRTFLHAYTSAFALLSILDA